MRLTFDHNLLIDLEEGKEAGKELEYALGLHDSGEVTICVSAIGASERLREKAYASSFSAFQNRVRELSFREFEILKPLGYWNVTFWDWCVWGDQGPAGSVLEESIHRILFPQIEFSWQDHADACGQDPNEASEEQHSEWGRWRNRKCDTLAMWCHIYYGGDAFVTRDKAFHQPTKKPRLIALGAKNIVYPGEVAGLLDSRGHPACQ